MNQEYNLSIMEVIVSNTTTNSFESSIGVQALSRIRRNHGLEHATLHILSERLPRTAMAGHSDLGGFWLLGNVPTEAVQSAVEEALNRLRAGEKYLAVHPNCGTNFAVSGTIAGLAGALALLGAGRSWRDKVERLPLAASLATIGLIVAQPLGLLVQERITTSGEPGDLEIVEVIPSPRGRVMAHHITTRG
jgi:hypothetical protein